MIIELLFKLFFGLITFIVNLIPNFDVAIDFSAVLEPLGQVFGLVGNVVDLKVCGVMIAVIILRDNFVLLKDVFVAIIHKIPFIN